MKALFRDTEMTVDGQKRLDERRQQLARIQEGLRGFFGLSSDVVIDYAPKIRVATRGGLAVPEEGALVVDAKWGADEAAESRRIWIDGTHRPLPEDLTAELGAIANHLRHVGHFELEEITAASERAKADVIADNQAQLAANAALQWAEAA